MDYWIKQKKINIFLYLCNSAVTDLTKKQKYRQKIEEYLARGEELKVFVKEEKEGEKQITIYTLTIDFIIIKKMFSWFLFQNNY